MVLVRNFSPHENPSRFSNERHFSALYHQTTQPSPPHIDTQVDRCFAAMKRHTEWRSPVTRPYVGVPRARTDDRPHAGQGRRLAATRPHRATRLRNVGAICTVRSVVVQRTRRSHRRAPHSPARQTPPGASIGGGVRADLFPQPRHISAVKRRGNYRSIRSTCRQ